MTKAESLLVEMIRAAKHEERLQLLQDILITAGAALEVQMGPKEASEFVYRLADRIAVGKVQ